MLKGREARHLLDAGDNAPAENAGVALENRNRASHVPEKLQSPSQVGAWRPVQVTAPTDSRLSMQHHAGNRKVHQQKKLPSHRQIYSPSLFFFFAFLRLLACLTGLPVHFSRLCGFEDLWGGLIRPRVR